MYRLLKNLAHAFALRSLVSLLFMFVAAVCLADVQDPYDPFSFPLEITTDEEEDKDKPADLLVQEAEYLFMDDRPLDARTKLLRALKKEPDNYKTHKLLAGYYLVHVGHFRLALKYINRSRQLFEEKEGKPPYLNLRIQSQHAHMLHLLSQIRLNLDNYQGALQALDDYTSYGYYQSWYPGSRAWILMKLGRVEEAIRVARTGLLADAEKGRTLNILGILLSVNGQRKESLRVFKDAIRHEFSLGSLGQPATPLNNSGEVYREIFNEELAERSWLKSTSLPDGCEHVLPSLNLVILFIEQLKYAKAKQAIDSFESCIAQYPLRNGEEHKALVHLARGRIALHSGFATEAVEHLEAALDKRQWFGKIGSSQEDLEAAATISLADALEAQANHIGTSVYPTVGNSLAALKKRIHNQFRVWWLRRRARQILAEDLKAVEDIYVRNTDSVIEYPTFGTLLSGYPLSVTRRRIELEMKSDNRPESSIYYDAWLGESYLAAGYEEHANNYLNKSLRRVRGVYDDALKLHILQVLAAEQPIDSESYANLANRIYYSSKAALRNKGLPLPVFSLVTDREVLRKLDSTNFYLSTNSSLEYSLSHSRADEEHVFHFASKSGFNQNIKVSGKDLDIVLNELNNSVFQVSLSGG